MKNYIAGQLYCLPHILPMFAPTINSYKRLVEGAWAPTTLTWGIDNRTIALRVLAGSNKSCRLGNKSDWVRCKSLPSDGSMLLLRAYME